MLEDTEKASILRFSSIILTFSAMILWLSSVTLERPNPNNMTGFGLITILPISYFVAVALLTLSFIANLSSKRKRSALSFFQVILLIFMLSLTPTLIEGRARFSAAYGNFIQIDYISQEHKIDPSSQLLHNWPGFLIVFSTLIQASAIPDLTLLAIYPMLFNVMLFFVLFMFFQLVLDNDRLRWFSIWTFYIANWIGQDYLSPQSLGFFIFVIMLFVIFKLMNSRENIRQWSAVLILLFSVQVVGHMLSTFITLSVIFVLFVSRNFRKAVFVLFFAVMLAAWTIFGAVTYLNWNLATLVSEVFNFGTILQHNVGARLAGNEAHIMAAELRLGFAAAIIGFAFCGFVIIWRSRKVGDIGRKLLLTLIGMSLVAVLFTYGGELFLRLFLFSLIPLCYFIAKNLNRKVFFSVFAIFLIVAAPPLYVAAHYGNELIDYVPSIELDGAKFFHSETMRGYVIGEYRKFQYWPDYKFLVLSDVTWENNTFSAPALTLAHSAHAPVFVVVSHKVVELYYFEKGDPQFVGDLTANITKSPHYNLFYSNPDFEAYIEISRPR